MESYTEELLKRIDKNVKKRFKTSVFEVIENPSNYVQRSGSDKEILEISNFVMSEIDSIIGGVSNKAKDLHDHAVKTDEMSKRFSSYISAHAKQNDVPILKPASSEVSYANKDQFYVGWMDDSTTHFIEKIIESSNFIVDISRHYDDYTAGRWLFCGKKDYVLGVYAPKMSIVLLKESRSEINRMLKEAYNSVKGL